MQAVALRAHFDGERICLDEPYQFAPNKRLLVMVTPFQEGDAMQEDEDRQDWLALSLEGLSRAYGDDEPEYSLSMLREVNPDYAPQTRL